MGLLRRGFLAASVLILFVGSAAARRPIRARNAMVVAQEPNAADAGLTVLKSGGNAVDAAVAVAFALAVTHPSAGNLGGGGFLLLRTPDGASNFIDFRERAPLTASRNMYLDADGNPTRDSIEGWRAAGVPGTVRGLELAHKKYGSKPWADLVSPAIRLAREGFEVSDALASSLRGGSKRMEKFPESKRIFLKDGAMFEMGDQLVQPELAATLDRIAQKGAADFYEGETARILAEECAAAGGLITLDDLRGYRAIERKPLQGAYRGYRVLTAPPPSSGGVGLLQMMAVLESSGYEKHGPGAAAGIHFVAEAMRRYYADRAEHLADPDFHRVPMTGLLSSGHVSALRQSIQADHATPSAEVRAGSGPGFEPAETTHFSIVDASGMAVALTYTINGSYGNGVTVPRLGFLLNNEMDDFASKPGSPNLFGLVQGEANAIQPRKTPLSSMTPTILEKDGKVFMVVGAPGGSRIITGVMQVILNVVDHGMNAQEAIDAPRFHHQWQPDRLELEDGFSPDTVALLKQRGHEIGHSEGVARVEAIVIKDGWLHGGSDGRASGKAAGF